MVPTTRDSEAGGPQLQGLPEPYILVDCFKDPTSESQLLVTSGQLTCHLFTGVVLYQTHEHSHEYRTIPLKDYGVLLLLAYQPELSTYL